MQISDEERDRLMSENTMRMLEQGLAAGQKRIDDANNGKSWLHAWISSRKIKRTATTHVNFGIFQLGKDTLHESIIVYQGGKRLETRGGYRLFGNVTARDQPYNNDDTVCDFALQSTEPVFISYLLANMSKGTQESLETMNIGFFNGFIGAVTGDPQITIERLSDVAKAAAVVVGAISTGGMLLLSPTSIRTLATGLLALRGIIIPNQDGPVAYGVICIKDPKNLVADDTNTDLSPVQHINVHCTNYTGGSDYAADLLVKPMNAQDRSRAGIA